MWHFVHISTLKKNARRTKAHPPQTQGNFNARRKRIDLPSEKSHIFKKIIRFARESPSGCPFACQTATALSALMSLLYRPHACKRDISLLATDDFHASSRFFLPRFSWFPVCITNFRAFLLFCCGRSAHRKPAIFSTFYLLCAIGRP